MLGEFDLIADFFAPLAANCAGALGLQDDAAILQPKAGRDLVVTKDLMVAGVHFSEDDPADLIARKLLRVNLSDLASMGADGIGYALGFAAPPEMDIDWVQLFCAGLAEDQKIFNVSLIGGDTVQTPGPLTLSLTAFGDVPAGQALKRSNAKPGDLVMVSGTIGDGVLGLDIKVGKWPELSVTHQNNLRARLQLPEPRLALGYSLRGIAHGAADISDGLVADLGHICTASHVGAVLDAVKIPLSEAAKAVAPMDANEFTSHLITGGDDYELVFTIAPEDRERVGEHSAVHGIPLTEVGQIVAGDGVKVLGADGRPIKLVQRGYRHF